MTDRAPLYRWVDHPEHGQSLVLPGFVSAHSHAFQRGLRGLAQRTPREEGTFWSWREAMYSLALSLDPESIYRVSLLAFEDLAAAGVVAVGEFHYVHHNADGTPYSDRTVMADAVIRAALETGMQISLLRVAYARAGKGRPPEGAQKRFSDTSVESVIADIETLRKRWAHSPSVTIGVAPHSVRAVDEGWLRDIAVYARANDLVLHMHVDEQQGEIDACVAEYGLRPVALLERAGILESRVCAVHMTCADADEIRLFGAARGHVCACPTTERDLGDGLGPFNALRSAGAVLCVGADSHGISEHVEEIRALEMHERLRERRRVTFEPEGDRSPAEQLLFEGSVAGARAIGLVRGSDAQALESWRARTIVPMRNQPSLRGVDLDRWADAVVFSGSRLRFERDVE